MQLKYYNFMTPSWLKANATFGTEVQCNDVELSIPGDTRFNETIFQVPILGAGTLDEDSPYAVRITAGLEYKAGWGVATSPKSIAEQMARNTDTIAKLMGRIDAIQTILDQHSKEIADLKKRMTKLEAECRKLKEENARLAAQIASLQSQINQMRARRRDPMCIMVSGDIRSVGFELRDPAGYEKYGPYRGVEGFYGRRGLINSTYVPENAWKTGVLEPTESARWPQVFRMQLFGDGESNPWGTISSDIDGGHSASFEYSDYVDVSSDLKFTVYRGERNEVYHINYFEVSVFQ